MPRCFNKVHKTRQCLKFAVIIQVCAVLNNSRVYQHAGACVCAHPQGWGPWAYCWEWRKEAGNPSCVVHLCLNATDQYRECWQEETVLACKSVYVCKPPQAMCFTFVTLRENTLDWGRVNRERWDCIQGLLIMCVDMLQGKHGMRVRLKGHHSQHS